MSLNALTFCTAAKSAPLGIAKAEPGALQMWRIRLHLGLLKQGWGEQSTSEEFQKKIDFCVVLDKVIKIGPRVLKKNCPMYACALHTEYKTLIE